MKFLGKMTSYPGLEVSSFLLPRGSKGEKKDKENAKKKEKEKEKMVKMGGGKVRSDEERLALKTKNARAHTSVQDAPPP